ncbi:MAG: FHA domain-containing protein [Clostridiales bacterium]|nr:FHA domain-containing protein [Clostridiales bacterium]
MKVSYTEDGYLKIQVEDYINVDYSQLQGMNSLPYFIPSLKDRYEDNVILYHKGEYKSITEHVQGKVYLFKDFQALLLVLLETFAEVENKGYILGNACVSLDNIFIHPQSGKMRIVYVPTKEQLNTKEDCIKKLLSELFSKIQTKDCALLLGVLLENKNCEEIVLDKIIEDVKKAKEKITDVSERIVEKRIEVPIEKIIYKSKNYSIFCGIVIAIECMSGFFLPIILNGFMGHDGIALKNIITINGIAVFLTIMAMVLLRDKDIKEEAPDSLQSNHDELITKQVQPPERKSIQDENNNLDFARNDMSNARVSRNNMPVKSVETTKKQNENRHITEPDIQSEFVEEGTCVLYGDATMLQAYFLESGKTGLMDRIFIDKSEFVIGRENGVDFKIDDSSVSKKHAKILSRNGKYYIEDLESSNGTKVNNVFVKDKVELTEGSQIKLGNKIYVFHNE